MTSNQLSLILLPANKCNVACEYCFEDKTQPNCSRARFARSLPVLPIRSGVVNRGNSL